METQTNVEKILDGKISYDYIQELINLESREFNIRKTLDNKFILGFGDTNRVKRGDGINYLHFHPDGSGIYKINEEIIYEGFEGLPSMTDIAAMCYENEPHMVISKKGISVYSKKNKLPQGYEEISKILGFPNVDSIRTYEDRVYESFRSKVQDKPIKVRMDYTLIEYLPWNNAFLQEHDFRKIPKLKFNAPEINIAKFMLVDSRCRN